MLTALPERKWRGRGLGAVSALSITLRTPLRLEGPATPPVPSPGQVRADRGDAPLAGPRWANLPQAGRGAQPSLTEGFPDRLLRGRAAFLGVSSPWNTPVHTGLMSSSEFKYSGGCVLECSPLIKSSDISVQFHFCLDLSNGFVLF